MYIVKFYKRKSKDRDKDITLCQFKSLERAQEYLDSRKDSEDLYIHWSESQIQIENERRKNNGQIDIRTEGRQFNSPSE